MPEINPLRSQALALRDLAFELQLLLGADEIVSFIETQDNTSASDAESFGNLVNYFKDSIYLHARNLLNALTNGYKTEIGAIPSGITSELYGRIKVSLEFYVTHLKKPRDQRGVTNVRDGRHLNEYVHELTAEVKRCWNEWAKDANNQQLRDILASAEDSAHNDCSQLKGIMK